MASLDQPPSRLIAPPRLHWFWVFLLSALTSHFFAAVWLVVLANWARKVQGYSRAYPWCVAALLFSLSLGIIAFWREEQVSTNTVMLVLLFLLLDIVVWLTAVFKLRSELMDEPVGLSLDGVITFLFSSIYFQYHLHDYPVQQLSYGTQGSVESLQ